MFAIQQLSPLLSLIDESAARGTPMASDAIRGLKEAADQLRTQEQRLVMGQHHHRHGTSTYLFIVAAGASFGEQEFEDHLQEAFEPEREEVLELMSMDEPTVVA